MTLAGDPVPLLLLAFASLLPGTAAGPARLGGTRLAQTPLQGLGR